MTKERGTGRLLFIVNDAGYFLSHRLPLALAAQAAGWEVAVATAPGPAQQGIAAAGFAAHSLPLSRAGLRPDRELAAVIATWRLLRRLRPRLVHCVALKATVIGGLASALAGVPARVFAIAGLGHVFSDNGSTSRLLRWGFARLVPLLAGPRARIILQNPDDLERLAEAGAARTRLVLIAGSGVDLQRFVPQPEPSGPVTLLLASRMIWKKGVGHFVEAARRLRAEGLDARFLLAGDSDPGNPAAIPQAQLADWAREGAVEWLGFQDDMPALLARCHIVCLPSSYGEGVPLSLIEGAAAGRPLVTTNMPGCRAIARDGENGLLVAPDDVAALATALRQLIEDPALRRQMGARGRAIAEAEFGLERVNADTLAVYRALLP